MHGKSCFISPYILGLTKRQRAIVTHFLAAMKQINVKVSKMPFHSFEEIKRRVHGTLVNEKLTGILTGYPGQFLMHLAALVGPVFIDKPNYAFLDWGGAVPSLQLLYPSLLPLA